MIKSLELTTVDNCEYEYDKPNKGFIFSGFKDYYTCKNDEFAIPSVIDGRSVNAISDFAFVLGRNLKKLIIPKSIFDIGTEAFLNCDELEYIEIHENNPKFSSIDGVLFSKDKKILYKYPMGSKRKEYNIPKGVKGIAEYAFCDSYYLINITIPDTVINIGKYAFGSCPILKKINIPYSINYLGEGTFKGCSNLIEIQVSENNPNYSTIDGVLFSKDKKLLIKYPEGAKCKIYTIPDSVTNIDVRAFEECVHLICIIIPDLKTKLSDNLFKSQKGGKIFQHIYPSFYPIQ